MIALDAAKAAVAPYLFVLKIGAVALCLVGLWYWHYHDRSRAVAAALTSLKAEYTQAEAAAKEKADKRLADQRAEADKALASYVADRAAWEQKLKGRQNELRKTAASLASCRLGLNVVRMLNDSRSGSASHDRPAESGSPASLPNP